MPIASSFLRDGPRRGPATIASNPKSGWISFRIARRSQIAGQEDQGALEIHRRVVAQPEDRFVEHAQQQARHAGRGFFDFIEENQRQAARIRW